MQLNNFMPHGWLVIRPHPVKLGVLVMPWLLLTNSLLCKEYKNCPELLANCSRGSSWLPLMSSRSNREKQPLEKICSSCFLKQWLFWPRHPFPMENHDITRNVFLKLYETSVELTCRKKKEWPRKSNPPDELQHGFQLLCNPVSPILPNTKEGTARCARAKERTTQIERPGEEICLWHAPPHHSCVSEAPGNSKAQTPRNAGLRILWGHLVWDLRGQGAVGAATGAPPP